MTRPRIDGGGWNHSSVKPDRDGDYEAWIAVHRENEPPIKEFRRCLEYRGGWPTGIDVLAWREFAVPSVPKSVAKMMVILTNCYEANQYWQGRIDAIEERLKHERAETHRPRPVQHADGSGDRSAAHRQ